MATKEEIINRAASGGIEALEAELQEADDEITRLRTALMELQRLGEQGMKPDYGNWLTFHDKVAEVARTALEQKAAPDVTDVGPAAGEPITGWIDPDAPHR